MWFFSVLTHSHTHSAGTDTFGSSRWQVLAPRDISYFNKLSTFESQTSSQTSHEREVLPRWCDKDKLKEPPPNLTLFFSHSPETESKFLCSCRWFEMLCPVTSTSWCIVARDSLITARVTVSHLRHQWRTWIESTRADCVCSAPLLLCWHQCMDLCPRCDKTGALRGCPLSVYVDLCGSSLVCLGLL